MINKFLPINNKKIGILGAGKSGLAAAKLAHNLGANVFLSDIDSKNSIMPDGIEYEFGKHSKEILKSDIVIKSPGINNQSTIIKKIIDLSIPIISEIEFASWFTNGFIIALTGTNGKSTTVKLINSILKDYGFFTLLGGNIGIPFSKNVLDEISNGTRKKIFHILEISSFQLEHIYHFKPHISIILNIAPDHLDRYESFQEYFNQKLKILINQDKDCYALINQNHINISDKDYDVKIIRFNYLKNKKISINNPELEGNHNYENILAASIVSKLCGVTNKSMIETINHFKSLSHRLEKIISISGINYYNDSKATNLSATIAAIETIKGNIILILGGIDKNDDDFTNLIQYKNKIKNILLYGDSRDKIKKQIHSFFDIFIFHQFKEAIQKSIELSKPNDNVLLSPACASFDQFNNYEERGNYFRKIISNYYATE